MLTFKEQILSYISKTLFVHGSKQEVTEVACFGIKGRKNMEVYYVLMNWRDVAVLILYALLTLLCSERPKLYTIVAFLSAKGLIM